MDVPQHMLGGLSADALKRPADFPIELTKITKENGPLTKRIFLSDGGELASDGSACLMAHGSARRIVLEDVQSFADLLPGLMSNEAFALGALRDDLPDICDVVTKRALNALGKDVPRSTITRTSDLILYRPGQPALVLIDYDTKGMPSAVADRLQTAGGFWTALVSVVPALADTARVIRSSTSSGIARCDTGEKMKGSDGQHVFVLIKDGSDTKRFLQTLHELCWLRGLGWMMVGQGGQLLERSIVDRMVYAGERLVFEAAPILDEQLTQDLGLRAPVVFGSGWIDTLAICPNLTAVQKPKLSGIRDVERHRLRDRAAEVRVAFIEKQAAAIAASSRISLSCARRTVERLCGGVLLPSFVLPFDDPELASTTVGDVLTDPRRFTGETLADPLEGVAYGPCKAMVMRRPDGSIWIHSFAHGRTTYDLKHDAVAVEAAVQAAAPSEAADVFIRLSTHASLTADEEQRLQQLAAGRANIPSRAMAAKVKQSRSDQAQQQEQAERDRASATRVDRRLQLPAPAPDAERLPTLLALDEVLSKVDEPEPPMRDLDGYPVEIRGRTPMGLHELTSDGANQSDPENTRLPAPEMLLLTPHDRCTLDHMVERHIEFINDMGGKKARSVALPPAFTDHYIAYRDSALPRVGAVVTAPLVLPDGRLLATPGLDRQRRLVLRLAPELLAQLPDSKSPIPNPTSVAQAFDFLVKEWLCDVAADFTGKCVLIALCLTILERVLLPERPAFFVTAGKRGGGKTTALAMIILAVTGRKPAAAAWADSEDERRKALGAYLAEGLPAMVFDNIPLGTTISCPTIERILTAESYSDQILGETAVMTLPSFTILTFTGNNIGPRGDLASRSLIARLTVDGPNPENRPFKHADPIAWTLDHRGAILQALYVLLLGNPQLRFPAECKTRFKPWWHLVGSAVEHAARQWTQEQQAGCGNLESPEWLTKLTTKPVDFANLFAEVEGDDEEACNLAEILDVFYTIWPDSYFHAADVTRLINGPLAGEDAHSKTLREYFDSHSRRSSGDVSTMMVGRRLGMLTDAPVVAENRLLTLRRQQPTASRAIARYRVWVE